jgi:hypothetical protein
MLYKTNHYIERLERNYKYLFENTLTTKLTVSLIMRFVCSLRISKRSNISLCQFSTMNIKFIN